MAEPSPFDPPPQLPAQIAGLALSTALFAFAAGVMVARNLRTGAIQ